MLQQRWHPVDIFVACLAPPKPYTTAFHWWCTLRRGELLQSKPEDVGGVRTYVWQIFNTADKVLATLSSTWKCLVSMWGWNVASKRCCLFSGNDIADWVKDKISMVVRRPYLATSQASRVVGFDSGTLCWKDRKIVQDLLQGALLDYLLSEVINWEQFTN